MKNHPLCFCLGFAPRSQSFSFGLRPVRSICSLSELVTLRPSANPLPHPGEKFKFLFKKLPTIARFAENTFYLSKSKRLESFIFKALDILNSIIVEGLLFPDSILPIYV